MGEEGPGVYSTRTGAKRSGSDPRCRGQEGVSLWGPRFHALLRPWGFSTLRPEVVRAERPLESRIPRTVTQESGTRFRPLNSPKDRDRVYRGGMPILSLSTDMRSGWKDPEESEVTHGSVSPAVSPDPLCP